MLKFVLKSNKLKQPKQFCVRTQLENSDDLFFFYKLIYLFIYFWLRWVFIAVRGLSLVVVSRGYSSFKCTVFSLRWLLLLRSMGSRRTGFSSCGMQAQQLWLAGSRAQAQQLWCMGLSFSVACGIFLDQGLNPCPLHWQEDS